MAAVRRAGRLISAPCVGGKLMSKTGNAARVLLAAPRGYCAGVQRAVTIVERALAMYGAPVYVRRHIVHNVHVVDRLRQLGAVFVEETTEVPTGAVLIFSAHGVAPREYEQAAQRQLRVIDATCPLVSKVHREASRLADAGYEILMIGQPGHDETIGTVGVASENTQVIDPSVPVGTLTVRNPSRVAWLSQTTLSIDETEAAVRQLRDRLPMLVDPPSDDLCYAAQNRQNAVKAIARQTDVMLVVGSAHSHNSTMLTRVAREHGAGAAYLIDGPEDIDPQWLTGGTVGVTAGASAPADRVSAVVEWLAARGYRDVVEVEVAAERQQFALPAELREPTGQRP